MTFTAKKLAAACIRLLAFGMALRVAYVLISAHLSFGRLPGGAYALLVLQGLASVGLFIYAIPLARALVDDIDKG